MLLMAIGAFEGNNFAPAWDWFVVSSSDAALVPTMVGFPGVVSGVNRAREDVLLEHLIGVDKLVTVAALAD
jgi:hypothetical protein